MRLLVLVVAVLLGLVPALALGSPASPVPGVGAPTSAAPQTAADVWEQEFVVRFGAGAGPHVMKALQLSSRVLPRIVAASVPYRMFTECLMKNTKRAWTVEEMAAKLKTTKPTIYRHLNKLKAIDILEEVDTDRSGDKKKGYRIRYGDLSKAWNFTEANVEMAMEAYRKTIDHLQKLYEEGK